MQVTLQCVGAVWGCVMAGMMIQSLGIFFLYSSINMPLDLSTDEVSELGIYSKLSLVWDNLS